MAVEILWGYKPGSRTNGTRTHAQSRGDIWRGWDSVVKWWRTGWGYDVRHRYVESGRRIIISFGLQELNMGGNTYALGMKFAGKPNFFMLNGNFPGKPSLFKSPEVMGRVNSHETLHVWDFDAKPSADESGHSTYAGDWFNLSCGPRFRDPSVHAYLKKKAGIIKGWRPKVKSDEEAVDDELLFGDDMFASPVFAQESGISLVACGCCV